MRFTKMHGAGNDFVVIDAREQRIELSPADHAQLADRRFGVGCDQVLVIRPPQGPDELARVEIRNADGGEAEQCGNGMRCVGRYLVEHGADPSGFTLGTVGGPVKVRPAGDAIEVDMGAPRFAPGEVPFDADHAEVRYPLRVLGEDWSVGVLSMGNPHAVLEVDDVDRARVAALGPAIETHARFPRRTNVGFMQRIAADRIRLRVHERGVGETLACGTGACAAVVWGRRLGLLDERVAVDLPGGRLVVSWPGGDAPVFLSGPAVTVFHGESAGRRPG